MKWQSGKRVVYHDILFQNISKAVKKNVADHFSTIR